VQLSACRVISRTIVVVLTARRIRAELHVYSRTMMKVHIYIYIYKESVLIKCIIV